jgi:uncharacterized cupin superfamily protein
MNGTAQKHWLRVSDDLLHGKGLVDPYNMGSMEPFIDWVDNPEAQTIYKVLLRGELLVEIAETTNVAAHFPNFPNDELIYIIAGGITLTSDASKVDQSFYAGDRVMIPKGWAGIWRVHAGVYRAIATVPANYFDISSQQTAPPNGVSVFAIDPPKTLGTHQLHNGTYIVEAQNAFREETVPVALQSDEVIHVLGGTLTLNAADQSEMFNPGDVVVLPKGFEGESHATAGYRALIARAK